MSEPSLQDLSHFKALLKVVFSLVPGKWGLPRDQPESTESSSRPLFGLRVSREERWHQKL